MDLAGVNLVTLYLFLQRNVFRCNEYFFTNQLIFFREYQQLIQALAFELWNNTHHSELTFVKNLSFYNYQNMGLRKYEWKLGNSKIFQNKADKYSRISKNMQVEAL